MVNDLLREVLPRSGGRHGAEVEEWFEVEDRRLWNRIRVFLVPEDGVSPATDNVTWSVSTTLPLGSILRPRTYGTFPLSAVSSQLDKRDVLVWMLCSYATF